MWPFRRWATILLSKAFPSGDSNREDHLTDFVEVIEEHVLRPAQADTFGAQGDRGHSVVRFRVRPDLELAMLVRPLHQLVIAAECPRIFGLLLAHQHIHHL